MVNINPTVGRATVLALAATNLSQAVSWLRGGRNRVIKFMHRGMLYTAASVAGLLLLMSQCNAGDIVKVVTVTPTSPITHLPTLTPTPEMIAVPCTATPLPTSTSTPPPTATSAPSTTGTPTATVIWSTSTPVATATPTATPFPISDDEINKVARMLFGEQTGQGEDIMRIAGWVTINRVLHPGFGASLDEVVNSNQFHVYTPEEVENLISFGCGTCRLQSL